MKQRTLAVVVLAAGLAVTGCYGQVQRTILIDSEPGKGTVVSVQLPAAEKEALEGDADHDNQQDGPSTGS